MDSLDHFMDRLAVQYISALVFHHDDKYSLRSFTIRCAAPIDVYRTMWHAASGLFAVRLLVRHIKYAPRKPIRDENGSGGGLEIDG